MNNRVMWVLLFVGLAFMAAGMLVSPVGIFVAIGIWSLVFLTDFMRRQRRT